MDAESIEKDVLHRVGRLSGTGQKFDYVIRFLEADDVGKLCELQQTVVESLSDPSALYVRNAEFFERCIDSDGFVVGALAGEVLIGSAAACTPGTDEPNYGEQVGVPADELSHVVHTSGSMIHPRYRGNGFQRQLAEQRQVFADHAGYYHQCGIAIPTSHASMRNHLRLGWLIKGHMIDDFRFSKFGEPHYVLHRDSRTRPVPKLDCPTNSFLLSDTRSCNSMFDHGYWGFRIDYRDDGPYVSFTIFDQELRMEASRETWPLENPSS